jgi:energy-coupling factor transport system permease protein
LQLRTTPDATVRTSVVTRSTGLHAMAWCGWGLAAVVVAQVMANPLTSALLIALAVAVTVVHHRGDTAMFRVVMAVGAVFVGVRVVIATMTTHGVGTTWFTLPSFTMPRWLGGYEVGGSVEQPVVLQALNEAMALLALFAVVGAFNACVSHHQLVRSLPRAFHEIGLVLTVALTFVPATVESVRRATEADIARTGGVRVRRRRWRRLVVPVVEDGLERAMNLAESLDARGFGAGTPSRQERRAGWCVLVGALTSGATLIALVAQQRLWAIAAGACAAGAIVAAIVLASRASGRPRHRPQPLAATDRRLLGASVGAMSAAIATSIGIIPGQDAMRWAANPLTMPQLPPSLVVAIALLAAPLVVSRATS